MSFRRYPGGVFVVYEDLPSSLKKTSSSLVQSASFLEDRSSSLNDRISSLKESSSSLVQSAWLLEDRSSSLKEFPWSRMIVYRPIRRFHRPWCSLRRI